MHDCSGGRGTTGGMGIGSGIGRFTGTGSACGWGGASCSPRGTSSVTYSIGPHGRGCARARGATIGRGARGRRTRKNARAPRKGRLPSLARPRGQFRRAKPRAAGRGLARPVVRVAVEAGVEAGRRGGERPRARPCRPHATLHRLSGFAPAIGHGWRLTTSRLTLSKRRLSAFAPALLSAETAAPHRAARLRHGARGDLPVRRQL